MTEAASLQAASTQPDFDAVAAARAVSRFAAVHAVEGDRDGGFPKAALSELARSGLLAAPAPPDASRGGSAGSALGEEPGACRLLEVLRLIGHGDLALGRLYEGHVNALGLVARYGTDAQRRRAAADAQADHLFGVWNTDPAGGGLRLRADGDGIALEGAKILASGAGFVSRALVTARRGEGDPPLMVLVPLAPGERADLSGWRAQGMRASATGVVDLSGLVLPADALVGGPDDYHREPFFSAGAWRFLAVQLGGIEAVFDAWRAHLVRTDRGGDPHQLARLGEGAIAVEGARLWVARAARVASEADLPAARAVAFVNLARLAVERAGLDAMRLAQRSVGLQAFLGHHPLERLVRDLGTYLRQPAPDRALTAAAAEILAAADAVGDLWTAP